MYSGGSLPAVRLAAVNQQSCAQLTDVAVRQPAESLHGSLLQHLHCATYHACCAGKQATSSYCVRKGLIRKAHLAHNLKKWAAKHPESRLAAATPETYILAVDDVDYIDEALSDLPEVRRLGTSLR